MSGHSKWSTIKRKKGAADAKRGKIFTKLIREIATAARLGGGNRDTNPRLRLAIEKARTANMPKDNIERGIKKGIGGSDTEAYDEVVYEGYGPGGAAVYVEVLTDNKNRSVGEVRHVLTKYGGNLGASGCAAHLFEKKGIIALDAAGIDGDALMEVALEAGAEDVVESDDGFEVIATPAAFEVTRRALEAGGFAVSHAEIAMQPKTMVPMSGKDAEMMLSLADALEDLDDVQGVHANFDISDEEMARLAS